MMKRVFLVVVSLVLTMILSGVMMSGVLATQSTPMTDDPSVELQAATAWLMRQQADGGGFPGFSGEPEVSITIDALIALAAAQLRGIDVGTSIDDAVAYLESGAGALVYTQTGVGQAAKLATGIVASGGDPRDIAGVNPLSVVEFGQDQETGLYGAGIFDHALAMLALGATGTELPPSALTVLEQTRTPEGGWAFDGTSTKGAADSNTTAMVVMGLVATGHGDSPLIGDSLAYLQTTLVGTSGATFQPSDGAVADANSTALVIQAIIAAGDDPAGEGWGDLPSALTSFQNDSGAFFFNQGETTDNLFSTVQVIPAAAGFALPIDPGGDVDATPVGTPVGVAGVRYPRLAS